MNNNSFDIVVVGMGIAGAFACYKLAKDHKDLKVMGLDIGRPPAKRKSQMHGFLGALPSSDGKLYLNDVENVANLIGNKKSKSSLKSITSIINKVTDFDIKKDKSPSLSTLKRISKLGFETKLNDYVQLLPKDVHALSRHMAEIFEEGGNITYGFDNEVLAISKQKNQFILSTEFGEIKAKKILLAVGRSGWRWANSIYSNFGIIESNDVARYGIRVEMPASSLKDFNKSNLTLIKKNDLEIGPLSWSGTVIPEDHVDMVISAFRSNEERWKTDKVSFSLIGDVQAPNEGFEQTDRIGKLTFILTNDRIVKEKVSTLLNKKSKISIIPEYDWLIEKINSLSTLIPDLATRAYFHAPTLVPLASKINIGDNLETEVPGMFVAGESAGTMGILAAAMTGLVVGEEITK